MNTAVNNNFSIKPLVAAVSVAISAASAFAAPTPNQMPGAGVVVACNLPGCTTYGGVTAPITGLVSGTTIGVAGQVVIQWGGTGSPVDVTNPAGFNIGSNGKLTFSGGLANSSVLNIDASGNASQIFGALESSAVPFGFTPSMFIANGNGIVLGAGGRIAAPSGIGLIGANLNNATAKNDFILNNSTGVAYLDVTGGQSTVTVNGAINGSLTSNTPAQYVLLVGGDITNTGNIYSVYTNALAGLRAVATTATVNAVAGTTVNRLFDVNAGALVAGYDVGTSAGQLEVASATSKFVNTGSIAGYEIHVWGVDGVRTGTAGSTDPLVGMYSDYWIDLSTVNATAKTEVYNVISGYTTNKSLGYFYTNYWTGTDGDVTINALTPGTQPSSIATMYDTLIYGQNIAISSTINHKLASAGGNQLDFNTEIYASQSLTTTADIGAGYYVYLENTGSGPMSIGGNVISDTNKNGNGGIDISSTGKNAPTTISGNLTSYGYEVSVDANGPLTISGNINVPNDYAYIYNYGTASGNTTTISGNVTAYYDVSVYNYGALSSNLNITGTLTGGDNVYVRSNGNLQLSKVVAGYETDIDVYGLSSMLNGPVTAGSYLYYYAPAAMTKAKPAAVLTSPYVSIEALNFVGVNASGATYANAGEKPAAQIVTNSLDLYMYGSFNAPIAGNTNWLTN
ncbi:MAG: hypothetical protein ABI777_03855, partial [Betaproteobacteria bacterium]